MAKKTENSNEKVVVTRSKDVVESYIFATSKRDFSIYSERLLLKIVEVAQQQLLGASFKDGLSIGQVSYSKLEEAIVEIPIRSLLGNENNTNYNQAREAIMELMSSPYFVERQKVKYGKPVLDDEGKPVFEMIGNQILNHCELNIKPGTAVLTVNPETWRAILDFSKGFRRYDLNSALKLKKPSALRLFRLLCGQNYPITYTIDQLREMWSLQDKYPDTSDFIRRTVESAKTELDEKAPWSFEYRKNYNANAEVNKGRTGKRSITSVTFIPVRKIANFSTTSMVQLTESPVSLIGRESYSMLVNDFGFLPVELKNQMTLFEIVRRSGMDLFGFLQKIKPSAVRAKNPQGYTVNALKRHLKEDHGVDFTISGAKLPKKGE